VPVADLPAASLKTQLIYISPGRLTCGFPDPGTLALTIGIMSPDEVPRSLEERVTRLECRAESRGTVVVALVFGVVVAVWLLIQAGVLKLEPGAPVG
jgi:hypothetical protein